MYMHKYTKKIACFWVKMHAHVELVWVHVPACKCFCFMRFTNIGKLVWSLLSQCSGNLFTGALYVLDNVKYVSDHLVALYWTKTHRQSCMQTAHTRKHAYTTCIYLRLTATLYITVESVQNCQSYIHNHKISSLDYFPSWSHIYASLRSMYYSTSW